MARSLTLFPREHGAYAELAFPLATGLLLGHPTIAAVLFACAAAAWFLAHEPVAILSGRRGERVRGMLAVRARRRLAWLAALGTGIGLAALATATPAARLATLVPLAGGVALVPAVVRGRQKTLPAEMLVVATLASCLLPVAIASGVGWQVAAGATVVWFLSFLLATVTVHGIKAAHKQSRVAARTPTVARALGAVALGGATLGAWRGYFPPIFALAVTPAVVVSVTVSLLNVHPRRLRAVGWSIVAANVVTLLALLAT